MVTEAGTSDGGLATGSHSFPEQGRRTWIGKLWETSRIGTRLQARVTFVAIGLLLWAQPDHTARGDQVSLAPVKDNTLYETADGSTSNGGGTAMFAGRNSQLTDSIRRALLFFDLVAAIPPRSTITGVELTLYNDAANAGNESVSLHRLLADWGEGSSAATGGQGSGAPAAIGDATWVHSYFDSQFWSQAGGNFEAGASASTIVSGAASYTWGSTPGMVADVQSWIDHPANNFGWCLVGNEAAVSTGKRFATRDEPDTNRRPALTVTYVPPANPVPTLSAWGGAILALGLLAGGTVGILKRATRTKYGGTRFGA